MTVSEIKRLRKVINMKNKNYMSELADMLGVEFDTEFNIEDFDYNPCKITKDGLIDGSSKRNISIVDKLLMGKAKIIKKPWKPKVGDMYYYLAIQDDCVYVEKTHWLNVSPDYELYHMGNFFRTSEEATRNINAYKEFLKSIRPQMHWRNS